MEPKKTKRTGRPRLAEDQARRFTVAIRLRFAEHRRLEEVAEDQGIPIATWARRAVLDALKRVRAR
jgi:hypothetical protein